MKLLLTLFAGILTLGFTASANEMDDLVRQHIASEMEVVSSKAEKNAAIRKCLKGDVYHAKVLVDGTYEYHNYLKIGDKITRMANAGPDAEMTKQMLRIINPKFRLKTEEDGKNMLEVVKALFITQNKFYAPKMAAKVKRERNKWMFLTKEWHRTYSGMICEVDKNGRIVRVRWSRSIKKN